jgi:hypothetical protein
MEHQKRARYLRTVGVSTFIKYFDLFQEHRNNPSNQDILDVFEKNKERWNWNSRAIKASQGKTIFKKGLEQKALSYVIENLKNVQPNIITCAKELLDKLHLASTKEIHIVSPNYTQTISI